MPWSTGNSIDVCLRGFCDLVTNVFHFFCDEHKLPLDVMRDLGLGNDRSDLRSISIYSREIPTNWDGVPCRKITRAKINQI